MAAVARKNLSTVGDALIQATGLAITVNGQPVALLGNLVDSHGDSPHNKATLPVGSLAATINGVAVVAEGHVASCVHVVEDGDPAMDIVPLLVGP